ncbi:MAG TPA: chloride channel protein [Nevskiaceae bacterium]
MHRLPFVEPAVMLATVVQWLILAMLTGAVVGTATSAFLRLLFTLDGKIYGAPLWLQMTLLPAAGLLNGLLLHYGYRANRSGLNDSIIVAVNEQHGHLPLKTMLIKPVAALITLWMGGSAGKEGPCSHLGAEVASGIGSLLHVNTEIRKRLVACGVSAGFASVFGTPIAGAIYGIEILAIGRIRYDFVFPGIVAGITSFAVSRFWGVPYPDYHMVFGSDFSQWMFLKTIAIGVFVGVAAFVFIEALRNIERATAWIKTHFSIWPPAMPLIGGLVMAVLIIGIPDSYLGLSLPIMDRALAGQAVPWPGFVYKIILVAITLGSGFYAGRVTPQFVIGALAGNALAGALGMSPALGAAVGFCAMVAAASNAPIAAIFMGIELFGGGSTPYIAGASIAAYLLVGHRSVYPEQQLAYTKTSWMYARPDALTGREKIHLSYGLLRWWADHLDRGHEHRPPRRR